MRLTSNGERKTWKVHRLVAAAFIPNEDNKVEVNHKDGNKSNNCVDNLEWNTPSENSIHAFRIGLRKNASEEKHGMAKLTKEQVLEIRKLREEGKPRKEVASIYGVHHCYITFLTSKKYWANI